jgi:AcrR family transcriptional regulator
VATRAGASEGIFHDVFSSVEECYRAAFEKGLDRLSGTVAEATARDQAWLERVRSGLVASLGFFDDEPAWARMLMLETPLNGALTFECARRLYELMASVIERGASTSDHAGAGRPAGSPTVLPPLAGELVVGGVLSVIRTSILEGGSGTLVELAPSLMAFIVAPYLGQVAAQAELEGKPSGAGQASPSEPRIEAISRGAQLPIRATHRTTLVLRAIAQAPYSNNREVAQAAGLNDEGQASKLLTRLERKGVIENVGIGAARGEPNAWLLTASGRRAVELLKDSFDAGAVSSRSTRSRWMA